MDLSGIKGAFFSIDGFWYINLPYNIGNSIAIEQIGNCIALEQIVTYDIVLK